MRTYILLRRIGTLSLPPCLPSGAFQKTISPFPPPGPPFCSSPCCIRPFPADANIRYRIYWYSVTLPPVACPTLAYHRISGLVPTRAPHQALLDPDPVYIIARLAPKPLAAASWCPCPERALPNVVQLHPPTGESPVIWLPGLLAQRKNSLRNIPDDIRTLAVHTLLTIPYNLW